VTASLDDKKLAIIGLGKLGGILLRSFLDRKLTRPELVRATVHHEQRAEARRSEFGVEVRVDNSWACQGADLILLCVKPARVEQVVREIAPVLTTDQVIVSVAASVTTSYIAECLDAKIPIIRAMPNTPCSVGCGMTAICRGPHVKEEQLEYTRRLFDAVGRTVVIDEVHFDAVTGLSASGPAFIYIILEALAEAGVKVGLPRDIATLLAAQTAQGAARVVLETGSHPALLKDAVTTPAGCTIDGIMELEEGKVRVTLIKAVMKATERARELVYGR
jgi:pyrroline-5-carboxylate reductase